MLNGTGESCESWPDDFYDDTDMTLTQEYVCHMHTSILVYQHGLLAAWIMGGV